MTDHGAARASMRLAEVQELIAYQPHWRQGEERGRVRYMARSAKSRVFAVHLGKNV